MLTGMEKDQGKNEAELKTNQNREEKRAYMVNNPGDEESLRYYDMNMVELMRGMGYVVQRVIDPLRKIKSIDFVVNSEVRCEMCEDMTKDAIREQGIKKGDFRVTYEGHRSSESKDESYFIMVCESHKPKKIEEKKIEEREMTEYSKWINDH